MRSHIIALLVSCILAVKVQAGPAFMVIRHFSAFSTSGTVQDSNLVIMGYRRRFPVSNSAGKMYVGNVTDNKFRADQIITWTNNGYVAGYQWLGWIDRAFANNTLRFSFWVKFLVQVPPKSNNFGIKIYGQLYNEFVDHCKADRWYYVTKIIKCGSSGDGYAVLLIFDSIAHQQTVRISHLKVEILKTATKPKPTISTFCLAESFGISIEKNISSFTSVTLKDPSCIGISNATHIILSTSFSECATSKSETKDHIVVSNEVRILGAADGQITRANQTIIPFECRYSRSGLETSLVSFQPKVKSFLQAQESGFGNFTINFEMARNAQFNSYFDTYPVATEINDRLYFQVSLNTNNTDTALLIESCHATSSMKKNDAIKYTLINNRCPTDSTLQFHFGAMHHKKFSFLAFNFLRNVPTIYMHCGVFLCHKASKDSRCTSGCSINKLPSTRKRRELEKREIPRESSEIYVLDNGPIQKREQSKKDSSLSSVSTIMIVMGLAVGILSLILASVFILKMRKKVLHKSSKQTIDSRGKQGMDNKAMEMENCA